MIFYHSNLLASRGLEDFYPGEVHVLASFLDSDKEAERPWAGKRFLDSGAFSAHTRGVDVPLSSLVKYLQEKGDLFHAYAALDVIGDPEASARNWVKMKAEGLEAIPTYHAGEPVRLLQEYLQEADHIAVGGMVGQGTRSLGQWLENVWNVVEKERPDARVHAFGLHQIDLLKRFPFYSADTRNVRFSARTGWILTPWGKVRINPQAPERIRWMKTRPLVFQKIQDWVGGMGLPFPFEKAQEQTREGILARCAVSLTYYEQIQREVTLAHRQGDTDEGKETGTSGRPGFSTFGA